MSIPRERQKLRWMTVKERVAHAYHDYGRLCAAHPVACLSMSIMTMIVLSYPTFTRLRLPVISPIDVYWSDQIHVNDAPSAPEWIYAPPAAYIQQIVVSAAVDPWHPANMTTDQAVRGPLSVAFRLRKAVLKVPELVESCLYFAPPVAPSLIMPGGGCLIISPASIWFNSEQRFGEDRDVVNTIFSAPCTSPICARDVLLGAPASSTGIKQRFETNRRRTIKFSMTMFFARYNPTGLESLKRRLEKEFSVVNSTGNDDSTFVHVYYRPLKQYSDYLPLVFTYLLCMVYLYFSSRKFEMVASRWGLAFAAAFSVFSTLVMTTGICAHLDLSTTLWGAELYPYIALIIGLENILCITRSVVYTPPSLDVSSRVAHGLSQEGYKLTKYFVLELFSLFCGYLTGVADIQEFCCFSAICLIVDFYMQLFFYAPCLTFDLQRLGLEEKRKFSEMLFSAEIPRLKNYSPVNCPMRKIWPKLFVIKKNQKRKLSDSQIDEKELLSLNKREHRRSMSTAGHSWASGSEESSALNSVSDESTSHRLKFLYFITRTRIVQRTIMVVFAIWAIWLAFFVHSRSSSENSSNSTMDAGSAHRILPAANLVYEEWQRRTYKWWPGLANDYNISLAARYVTFLPPIVIDAKVSPFDQMLRTLAPSIADNVSTNASETPILRSRIDWLETQLKVYLAAFWLLLLTTVASFFIYVCFSDRWKFGIRRVQEASVPTTQSNSTSVSTGRFIESLPMVFNGHRFPIEAVGIDVKNLSKKFVSCCQEGVVYIWNIETGDRVQRVNRMRQAPEQDAEPITPPKVWALTFKDEVAILGCADGSIELASVERNKLIGVYANSTMGISHVKAYEDIVLIGRLDGNVDFLKITYDLKTETQPLRVKQMSLVKTVRAHFKPICRMIVCKSQLITASFDRTIKVFDASSGDLFTVLLAHNSAVVNLAVDNEETTLFSSCEEGVICWWNLQNGELIRTIDSNFAGSCQIAVASDYLLGFYGNAQLYLWNRENGQLACRIAEASSDGFNEDSLCSCDNNGIVALDDNIAATASGSNVTFWDVQHRAIIRQVDIGSSIVAIRRLDTNRVLAVAGNEMFAVNVPVARIK